MLPSKDTIFICSISYGISDDVCPFQTNSEFAGFESRHSHLDDIATANWTLAPLLGTLFRALLGALERLALRTFLRARVNFRQNFFGKRTHFV